MCWIYFGSFLDQKNDISVHQNKEDIKQTLNKQVFQMFALQKKFLN